MVWLKWLYFFFYWKQIDFTLFLDYTVTILIRKPPSSSFKKKYQNNYRITKEAIDTTSINGLFGITVQKPCFFALVFLFRFLTT